MTEVSPLFAVAAAIVVAAVGYLVSRSIVAEADAHRNDQPDRWFSPVCAVCGHGLTLTMLRCSYAAHPQRGANIASAIVTPIVFVLVTYSVDEYLIPAYLAFATLMILLTVTDVDTKLIPNRILFPGTVISGALLAAGAMAVGLDTAEWYPIARAFFAGAAFFGAMFVLALLARGALGYGDVKLAFVIGLFTGYLSWGHLLVASIGGFILGGVVAMLLLVTRRASRKDAIPFGPFMTSGALLAVIFGDAIISWYLR